MFLKTFRIGTTFCILQAKSIAGKSSVSSEKACGQWRQLLKRNDDIMSTLSVVFNDGALHLLCNYFLLVKTQMCIYNKYQI